ncbi:hypothetical protein T440DRAFT_92132 [Plenodomus tracheiphilus IPT5]|uniref:Uncharacterized protein n=1 Tax=Plenodomus tracheiphilus IPT5 TaxID=1408161 RepID=A0A6A7B501_9PLEO|nr:hypothetical protein T440DRAFT_92132 [Plenodomus tracheiphilus IPT5]
MQGFLVDASAEGCRREGVEDTFRATVGVSEEAIKTIVESGKSGLIDLRVSRKPAHDSTKAMVGDTKEEGMIVVPYYDNLPRLRYGK